MFINHTNHASAKWSAAQKEAAHAWGEIEDLPFPDIGADWDEERVARLAEENAATTEEGSASVETQSNALEDIAQASEGLAGIATDLQREVERFKL